MVVTAYPVSKMPETVCDIINDPASPSRSAGPSLSAPRGGEGWGEVGG
jgi:hypothetical protein